MKLNVSPAIGVNGHKCGLAGKELASPGNTSDHKLLTSSNLTVYELFVFFQFHSATFHLLRKLNLMVSVRVCGLLCFGLEFGIYIFCVRLLPPLWWSRVFLLVSCATLLFCLCTCPSTLTICPTLISFARLCFPLCKFVAWFTVRWPSPDFSLPV